MGREPPDRIVQALDVWPGLEEYVEAFDVLSNGRHWVTGMAGGFPLAISPMEIESEARLRGFCRRERRRRFVRFVRAQDGVWLAHQSNKETTAGFDGSDDSAEQREE